MGTTDQDPNPKQREIEFFGDVQLKLSVELGRATISIRRLLELSPGSVIELGSLAGEALEIRANSNRIAYGEVVTVNGNYGIRVTQVAEPKD